VKSKKSNPDQQNFISKIYDSSHKWENDLWMLKWIALLVIIADFYWLNKHPIFKVDVIGFPVLLFLVYSILFTVFSWKKMSFKKQIFNLISDLLVIASFECLALSMFGYSSRMYVLFLLLVIYCSYWFKKAFTFIFVTLISSTYFIINYLILLTDNERFFIISEIKGTLLPVAAVFYIVCALVIFFKKKIIEYFMGADRIAQVLEKHAEKLEQEKEYTRSLLKDKIDGFIVINEKGYVTEINELACELFGCDEKDIYLKNVKDIYAPGEAKEIMKKLRKSPDGTIEGFRTFVINKKENKKIPILLSAALLYDRKNLYFKEELAKNKRFPSLGYFRDLRVEEVFDRIGKEIALVKDAKEPLDEIAGSISEVLKAEICCIIIYNVTTDQLEIKGSFGMPPGVEDFLKKEQYKEMEGMAGHVFSNDKTLNVKSIDIPNKKLVGAPNNIKLKWEAVENFAKHSKYKDFQHFLAAPLRIHGEVYGVIKVINKYLNEKALDENGFHDEDQNQLERICNQVSILVEKVRNKERFESISKIGLKLNERLDLNLDDFLKMVTGEIVHGMRFPACFIYIVEEENKLKIKACEGLAGNYEGDEKYTLEIGEGISGVVAQNAIYRIIADTSQDETGFKDINILKNETLETMLSVPISYEHRAFGVIDCCTRRPHSFTQEEIQSIQILASYIAIAIQNVKHFNETRIKNTMQAVGQIASSFAHKLKNDIGTITLYTGNLMKTIKPGEPGYFPLSKIKDKTTKITIDIDHLQKASKLYIQEKEFIYIKDIISELESEIFPDLETKKIMLDVKIPGDMPKIEIDPIQIKLVLWNLARNSIEAMPEGGKISISISKFQENILIEWTDSGTGIPPGNAQKIFEVFWTSKDKGYGLGLFHAKAIIEEHHGSIALDTNNTGGARFLIKLPLKQE
jgi:PAS domain S-box-containing protein